MLTGGEIAWTSMSTASTSSIAPTSPTERGATMPDTAATFPIATPRWLNNSAMPNGLPQGRRTVAKLTSGRRDLANAKTARPSRDGQAKLAAKGKLASQPKHVGKGKSASTHKQTARRTTHAARSKHVTRQRTAAHSQRVRGYTPMRSPSDPSEAVADTVQVCAAAVVVAGGDSEHAPQFPRD